MRLSTIEYKGRELAAIETEVGQWPLCEINQAFNTRWPETVWDILQAESLDDLKNWYLHLNQKELAAHRNKILPSNRVLFGPLYRHPGKIWGIGLNYSAHAADLSTAVPQEIPASFIKSHTTLIGTGDTILIPQLSRRTTAEAELGLVIGKKIAQPDRQNSLKMLAGYCSIIDMTAEDILRKDPRYLTLSKNFDTFFSLGPQLITCDEISAAEKLQIKTVKNGKVMAENKVGNMTFPPASLLAFHANAISLEKGDIISSGTPGAVAIAEGDEVECRISNFMTLKNSVKDLKRS